MLLHILRATVVGDLTKMVYVTYVARKQHRRTPRPVSFLFLIVYVTLVDTVGVRAR
jgi:hypothetical protein